MIDINTSKEIKDDEIIQDNYCFVFAYAEKNLCISLIVFQQ